MAAPGFGCQVGTERRQLGGLKADFTPQRRRAGHREIPQGLSERLRLVDTQLLNATGVISKDIPQVATLIIDFLLHPGKADEETIDPSSPLWSPKDGNGEKLASSRKKGCMSEPVNFSAASPALSAEEKAKASVVWASGRGRIIKVASTITPSVPNDPQ